MAECGTEAIGPQPSTVSKHQISSFLRCGRAKRWMLLPSAVITLAFGVVSGQSLSGAARHLMAAWLPVQHGGGTATGRITKLPRYLSRLVNEPNKDNSTAMGAATVATNSKPPLSSPAMPPTCPKQQSTAVTPGESLAVPRANDDGGECRHAGKLAQIESLQPCGWPAAVTVRKWPGGRRPTSSAEPAAYHGIAPPTLCAPGGYWQDPG